MNSIRIEAKRFFVKGVYIGLESTLSHWKTEKREILLPEQIVF